MLKKFFMEFSCPTCPKGEIIKMNLKYYRQDLKKLETINPTPETSMNLDEVLKNFSSWLVDYLIDYNSKQREFGDSVETLFINKKDDI